MCRGEACGVDRPADKKCRYVLVEYRSQSRSAIVDGFDRVYQSILSYRAGLGFASKRSKSFERWTLAGREKKTPRVSFENRGGVCRVLGVGEADRFSDLG